MTSHDLTHTLKKLQHTISILATLFMARTFGKYEVSCCDDGLNYARYYWKGKVWPFPTSSIEETEQ